MSTTGMHADLVVKPIDVLPKTEPNDVYGSRSCVHPHRTGAERLVFGIRAQPAEDFVSTPQRIRMEHGAASMIVLPVLADVQALDMMTTRLRALMW